MRLNVFMFPYDPLAHRKCPYIFPVCRCTVTRNSSYGVENTCVFTRLYCVTKLQHLSMDGTLITGSNNIPEGRIRSRLYLLDVTDNKKDF